MKYKERFRLLTFYKFIDVAQPDRECEAHLKFTKDIGMKGRIYIGTEGISATVSGNEGQIMAYKSYLAQHILWKEIVDIDIKSSLVEEHQFPRMHVKVRDEIVVLGKKYTQVEIEQAGNRMDIVEFKKILDSQNSDKYVILDMRNNYEYRLGHFKNAVPAGTISFKKLEEKIEEYKRDFGDKTIISYCTGGIRCEKSTVMFQKAGLKNIYQLDGGVIKYINTYDDGNWLGNLFVFDNRTSGKVGDKHTHTTIGKCCYSGLDTNNFENCRYSSCNARLIVTKIEYRKHAGFCSKECADSAIESLLVKTDLSFDSMNYKQERGDIKAHPGGSQEIKKKVQEHLKKILVGVEFIHLNSQKEKFI